MHPAGVLETYVSGRFLWDLMSPYRRKVYEIEFMTCDVLKKTRDLDFFGKKKYNTCWEKSYKNAFVVRSSIIKSLCGIC